MLASRPIDVHLLRGNDRFARRQVLRHIEVMPQRRKGLVCPVLQFRMTPPLT
jgi:hypothetical protein